MISALFSHYCGMYRVCTEGRQFVFNSMSCSFWNSCHLWSPPGNKLSSVSHECNVAPVSQLTDLTGRLKEWSFWAGKLIKIIIYGIKTGRMQTTPILLTKSHITWTKGCVFFHGKYIYCGEIYALYLVSNKDVNRQTY